MPNVQQADVIEFVAPSQLKPDPLNIQIYGEDGYQDLVESIKQLGVLQALYVSSQGLIISGHRRWRAAIAAECPTVPVIRMNYASDLDRRQAIIEHNRYRVKNGQQLYNEGKELESIESERARQRQQLTQFIDRGFGKKDRDMVVEILPPPLQHGKTRDIVAKTIGLGSGKQWDKLQYVAQQKPDLLKDIKPDGMTVGRAYILAKPHVSHNTGNNEWYTPPVYIEAARTVMGSIDVDPASSSKANETVRAARYHTIGDDGRHQLWHGNVWMNPPYAQPLISEFCDLLVKKYQAGEVKQACVLVNNATETVFYQTMLHQCAGVCFIKGRVKFVDEQGASTGAPLQGQTVLYFGGRLPQFTAMFRAFGVILHGNSTKREDNES